MRTRLVLLAWLLTLVLIPSALWAGADRGERIAQAAKFMAASDRYLHHDKLARGMTGYGLTVLRGMKIEKFDVEVISVMRQWGPQQDVILCKLSGLGLEKTGVISGMSGSPIYIKDPADGKAKLIGALAYGWRYSKEPLTGVQPIVQMLAVRGVPLGGDKPVEADKPAGAAGRAELDEDFVRAVLDPRKIDFTTFAWPRRRSRRAAAVEDPSALRPLAIPMMVSGASSRAMTLAGELFAGGDLVPLRAGGASAVEARAGAGAKLEPGSAVSVPMISGDMDSAAIGTVTEVIGDRVLAFGHSMYAEGPVRMPMATAYIHAAVPSTYSSFKLGATLEVAGALTQDEKTGVLGRIGAVAEMIPLTVTVDWPSGRRQFNYRLIRHRWLTALTARLALADSVTGQRDIPDRNTIEYAVDIDFEKFGRYHAANVSSYMDLADVTSDMSRPLAALMNTGLGSPAFPRSIDVKIKVKPVQTTADILNVALARNLYKPGEKVTGTVTLRPFRAERVTVAVALELPVDLPDGKYKLTVCDSYQAALAREKELPQRFRARTVRQLFDAFKDVVKGRADRLYVRLPLPAGGLAVDKDELEHLPASMAELLKRAAPMDTLVYRRSKVVTVPAGHVVKGSATAEFVVRKQPDRE